MVAGLITNLLEIVAFGAGIYYYKRKPSKPTKYLIGFLGLTVFIELINWYPFFIEDGILSFLKDTPLQKNYWISNIYSLISFLFYINYFKWFLSRSASRLILTRASIVFLIVGIFEIIFSEGFFDKFLPVANILGTLLVLFSIANYYLELLRSDHILKVYKILPFYISVGALIFHLCTTPLFIYSSYYRYSVDPEFVYIYTIVIFSTNYLLYSIYTAGFLICSRKKNLYFPKKNF